MAIDLETYRIDSSTRMIKTDTGEYPKYLADMRAENPNVTMPATLRIDQAARFKYAPVFDSEIPTGDVVSEVEPTLGQDGYYYRAYEVRPFNAEELAAQLASKKASLKSELDGLMKAATAQGVKHQFLDGEGVVTLTPTDHFELNALLIEGQEMVSKSDTTMRIYRCANGLRVELDGASIVSFVTSVMIEYNRIRQTMYGWQDKIEKATTIAELPTLPGSLI